MFAAFFNSHGNNSKIAKLNEQRPPPAYCALGGVAYCGVRSERRGMAGTLRTPLMFQEPKMPALEAGFFYLRPAATAPATSRRP